MRFTWNAALLCSAGLLAVAAAASVWFRQGLADAAVQTAPALPRLGSDGDCTGYDGLPPGWPKQAHAGMRRIEAGEAELGSERGYADERPVRRIAQSAFWIDATEVTNAQFAAFVAATAYRSDAERLGSGVVFVAPPPDDQPLDGSWWKLLPGADWRHPDGPRSSLAGRANHPVVQITRADAQAYAAWLGRELPSEAEWERAAKAGRDNASADAAVQANGEQPQANVWQGVFPAVNSARDRHAGRAPVGCYAANGYGLHDMIGNVWEWTRDDYAGAFQSHGQDEVAAMHASAATASAVIKGGSYLCAENFCVRYRASARHPQEIDLPTSHVGFRTVQR